MTTETIETKAAPSTTTLQMIRAEVNVRDFQRWMGTRRLQDQDHAMHCLLTECFGDLAPQPFRLIVPRGGATGCLYGYGQSGAEELQEAAAICADPLQSRILPPSTIDSKAMPTEWPAGKRLGFEVRVRPVIRRSRGAMNPGSERDVFQNEAEGFPKGETPRNREQVYTDWLGRRLEESGGGKGGANLSKDSVKLVSFQRVRSFRHLHSRYVEGPDAVMRGILTVTDSDAFAALLAHGIGRHRAYGYGMLLLRPARE